MVTHSLFPERLLSPRFSSHCLLFVLLSPCCSLLLPSQSLAVSFHLHIPQFSQHSLMSSIFLLTLRIFSQLLFLIHSSNLTPVTFHINLGISIWISNLFNLEGNKILFHSVSPQLLRTYYLICKLLFKIIWIHPPKP